MVASDKTIGEEDIQKFRGSMLFTVQDVQRLLEGKNQLIASMNTIQQERDHFETERNGLREELKEALAQGNVNIEEITNNMVKEERQKLETRFEKERMELQGFL